MEALSNAALDALAALLSQMAFAYGMTHLLPLRRVRLFWVLELLLWPLAQFMGTSMLAFVGGLAVMVVSWIVLPFVLIQEKPMTKALAICAALACVLVASAAGEALWALVLGSVPADYDLYSQLQRQSPVLYVLMDLVSAGMLVLLLSALRLAFRRKVGTSAASWPFALLMATQLLLLVLVTLAAVYTDLPLGWCTAELVAALLCLALDVVMLGAVRRFERKLLDEQRAELLEGQLSEYLESYGAVTEQLKRVAHVRHDLRNQLQVVELLVQQGERSQAQEQVRQLAERCGEASGKVGA